MKALQRTGSDLELREIDPPEPGPAEALIRVRLAGICSTDLEIALGYMNFQGTLGHEFVGEVVAAEDRSWVGARVAGEINLSCGQCRLCRRGLARHCPTRRVLGISNKDGCFAEYVTLPQRNLHRVPARLSDRLACFVEPLAAAFEVWEQVPMVADDKVVVLGDGKLGQLIAMMLTQQGIAPILAGKHAHKLALAQRHGVRAERADTLPAKEFDIVVEATGSPEGMTRALQLVRPRGTLVLKSTYHGELSFDAAPIVIDEISVVGSRCGPFPPALAGLASGELPVDALIDSIFPLEDAPAALAKAAQPGVLKVLIGSASFS